MQPMSPIFRRAAALLLALLLSPALSADTFTGKVVRVVDGDTLYVLDADNTQHKIRLASIDAPEQGLMVR